MRSFRSSHLSRIVVLGVLAALAAAAADPAGAAAAAVLEVDAREVARGVWRAELTMPVTAGPLTLVYPKWIPGEHGPGGPIASLSGLRFAVDGRDIPWRRSETDMFAIGLTIPAGARSLRVSLESLTSGSGGAMFSATASSTKNLAILSWNWLLLAPAGGKAEELEIRPSVRLPADWQYATALTTTGKTSEAVQFAAVSSTTLVDSPLLMGRFLKSVELTDEVSLQIAADSQTALAAIKPEIVERYRNLIGEAQHLFGARHFRRYQFLVALTDTLAWFGLEHHESSDNRMPELALVEDVPRRRYATLLPHEYVHSWNGKYRRPAGLATPDFQTPISTELLWVYEGLTMYYGEVLAARSGLLSAAEFNESLAYMAASMQQHMGRTWRSLADTAVAAQLIHAQPPEWGSRMRGVDIYPEGHLLWLEADVIIRRVSGGRRSLDDFCRLFHGGEDTPAKVAPYDLDTLIQALNTVQRYDWRGFWQDRLERLRPEPPLEGITQAGWQLTYLERPSSMQEAYEIEGNAQTGRLIDERSTLGFLLQEKSVTILDIIPDSPADVAGVPPGSTLIAVNGRRWSPEVFREALTASKVTSAPIDLLIERGGFFHTYRLSYSLGRRYPHLQRDESRPDILSEITRPRGG